jgi:hypothetical protein
MTTLAITIQTPPDGASGQSGNGSNAATSPASEANTGTNFVDALVSFLESLPGRPARRSGNVTGFDLLGPLGAGNIYLVLLSVDSAQGAVDDDDLLKLLPAGSGVSALGEFRLLDSVWRPQHRNIRTRAAFAIHTPPVGELETSGNGSDPTDEQMSEEKAGRDHFVEGLTPFLQSLLDPPAHLGQAPITGFDLFGIDQWSKFNNYLLLLTADDGEVDIGEDELVKVLPAGSQVSALGHLHDVAQRPAPFAFGSATQPRGGFT